MRTAILIGAFCIADAISKRAWFTEYQPNTQIVLFIILIICMGLDIIDMFKGW
jgi:hypothetical protein